MAPGRRYDQVRGSKQYGASREKPPKHSPQSDEAYRGYWPHAVEACRGYWPDTAQEEHLLWQQRPRGLPEEAPYRDAPQSWKLGPLWKLLNGQANTEEPTAKKLITTSCDPDTESTSAGTYSPGRSNLASSGTEMVASEAPTKGIKTCSASQWLDEGGKAPHEADPVRELVVEVGSPVWPLTEVSRPLPTIKEVISQEALASPSSRQTSVEADAGPGPGPMTLEVKLAPVCFANLKPSASFSSSASVNSSASTASRLAPPVEVKDVAPYSPIVIDVPEASLDSALSQLALMKIPSPSPREIEVTYVLPPPLL